MSEPVEHSEDADLPVIVRLDVPLSSLEREARDGYFQTVGKAVQGMMPPGPDPDGRGIFFLLMPTPDDLKRPYPYVTNADRATLAPVLGFLAERLAQDDPERLTSAETVARTLRRLSDAVEARAEDVKQYRGMPDGTPIDPDTFAASERVAGEFDAARAEAIRVLDALDPEPIIDTRPDRSHHAEETPKTPGDRTGDDQDRRSDVPGEVVRAGGVVGLRDDRGPDVPGEVAPAPAPAPGEPFRTRPSEDAV